MAKEAARRRRTPVAEGIRSRLSVRGMDPAYEYRWVNDVPGRVDDFKERDWELATEDNLEIGDRRVGVPSKSGEVKTVSAGQGVTSVLMKIKKEYYEEDQAAKQAKVQQNTQTKLDEAKNSGDYGTIKFNEK